MANVIKIPKDRVGPLIGEKGENKKKIEKELEAKLRISSDGAIEYASKQPLFELKLGYILKAVGRGFSVEDALLLEDDDYTLEVISIEEIVGPDKNRLSRCRSRIIGTQGSVKKAIEDMTNTLIVVYGKTVGIIGKFDDVAQASESVSRLIGGATHKAVISYLEKQVSEKYKSSRDIE